MSLCGDMIFIFICISPMSHLTFTQDAAMLQLSVRSDDVMLDFMCHFPALSQSSSERPPVPLASEGNVFQRLGIGLVQSQWLHEASLTGFPSNPFASFMGICENSAKLNANQCAFTSVCDANQCAFQNGLLIKGVVNRCEIQTHGCQGIFNGNTW